MPSSFPNALNSEPETHMVEWEDQSLLSRHICYAKHGLTTPYNPFINLAKFVITQIIFKSSTWLSNNFCFVLYTYYIVVIVVDILLNSEPEALYMDDKGFSELHCHSLTSYCEVHTVFCRNIAEHMLLGQECVSTFVCCMNSWENLKIFYTVLDALCKEVCCGCR